MREIPPGPTDARDQVGEDSNNSNNNNNNNNNMTKFVPKIALLLIGGVGLYYSDWEALDASPMGIQSKNTTTYSTSTTTTNTKLVWLMTFPNSGTSYTQLLVGHATQMPFAVNTFCQPLQRPVYANHKSPAYKAQYLHNNTNATRIPAPYVLTKTHCGGICTLCDDPLPTLQEFRASCATVRLCTNNTKIKVQYSDKRVAKVLLLYRHPVDNIVARFHFDRKLQPPPPEVQKVTNDRAGFREYCRRVDGRHAAMNLPPNFQSIPCHADFVRYIHWHNQAHAYLQDLTLQESVIVHYEDYAQRAVAERVVGLMELPWVGRYQAFRAGKHYDYLTDAELAILEAGLYEMASPATRTYLQRYLTQSLED